MGVEVRIVMSMFAACAALGASPALAQEAVPTNAAVNEARSSEIGDEVIVRGKRLADLRVEVEKARVRAYEIFNEINSTDDFDVTCNLEESTGTRLSRQVCAPRFEGRISSRAAKDYLAALRWICNGPGGLTQDCIFSQASGTGIVAARAAESEAPTQRDRMTDEINRLARTDLQFGQAILDFYDASLKYDEERKRPRTRER